MGIIVAFSQEKKSIIVEKKANNSNDTVQLDSINIKRKKGSKLEDVMYYDSRDQISRLAVKKTYLIDEAKINYGDMELTADYIEIDWNAEKVYARCLQDSLGKCKNKTKFKQGEQEFIYESLIYDIKSEKGFAENVTMNKGLPDDGIFTAAKIKHEIDSIRNLDLTKATGGVYSTDPVFTNGYTDQPDLNFDLEAVKIAKGIYIVVSRPVMKIEGIPVLMLPGAIIPMSIKKSSAGLIMPSFSENERTGFAMENLGFYIPFGDYVDVKTTLSLYTQGSWRANLESNYKKRYKFSGGLNLGYENQKLGTYGLSDYSESKMMNISWRHSQDTKSNPNLTFSANVNYSSSQYYRNTLYSNNYTTGNALNNTVSSSVSLSKRFDKLPISMSLAANLSQNINLETISMSLPNMSISMERQYPFAPKEGSKKGLLQNISVDYAFDFQNQINTYDSIFFKSQMWKEAQTGFQHKISTSTGITLAKFFPISFSANYRDIWYMKTIQKEYDEETNTVVDNTQNGFSTFRDFSLSTGISTNLYKTINFNKKNKNARIQAIRHVMTPSISYSFAPDFSNDFWEYYDTYRDGSGKLVQYSKYDGGIYGSPSKGVSNSLGFNLRHNLEMKVRDRKNDSLGFKKVKIFDYLNMSTGYNFTADKYKWSDINMSGSTKFFNDKVNVNFGSVFSVYDYGIESYDSSSNPVYAYNTDFALRMKSWNISTGYNFSNATFEKKEDKNAKNKDKEKKEDKEKYPYRGDASDRYDVFDYDHYGYAHYEFPWTLNLSLNHSVYKSFETTNRTTTLGISGSVEPTPYWKIGFTSNLDLQTQKFGYTTFNITRDLRSFNLNFNWVPFGTYKTWNFFIGIKANLLKDIKYEDKNPRVLDTSSFD